MGQASARRGHGTPGLELKRPRSAPRAISYPRMRPKHGFDRREFLSRTGLGGTLLAAGASLHASDAAAAPRGDRDRSALRALFEAPPDAGKPMTRWWWFGGAVTPEEVTRQLGS